MRKTRFTAVYSPSGDTECCVAQLCSDRAMGLKCDNSVELVDSH